MNDKWALSSESLRRKMDKIGLGLTLGLIAPLILLVVYWQINYSYMDMGGFINFLVQGQLHTKLISLFVVINLAIFFVFIWRDLNLSARGVLYATFIYTFIVGGYKLLA